MRRSLAVLVAAVVLLLALCPVFACADKPAVRKLVLNKESVSLQVGETFTLKVQVAPFTADRSVTWVSSNESVVSVSNGKLTALSIGSAEITVTSVSTPSIFLTARVMVVKPVESIRLEEKSIILPRGYTWDMIAYVLPTDATMQRPVWTSSDKRVATVDSNGVITAVANGNCTVIAAAADNRGARAIAYVQVRSFEAIITEPGEFHVDFNMIEDSGTDEITKGNKTVKDVWKKTVTFENEKLEKASDTSVIPLSAGAEIVHLREIHNKKTTVESRHAIFIAKSAVREAGSVPAETLDGEILFRDIPWGLRYKEVKTLLSARKEKLKSPIVRNGLLWTQINGEIMFGDFKAFRNGLSFSSSSANVENLTANLQKTAFCMGDYYFDKEIPFENLKQNVMRTYGLPENETTSSSEECVWISGRVTVRLFATPKFTQLQISYRQPEEENVTDASGSQDESGAVSSGTVSGTVSGSDDGETVSGTVSGTLSGSDGEDTVSGIISGTISGSDEEEFDD